MLQPLQAATDVVPNELLACGYSEPDDDSSTGSSEKAFLVDRDRYPFCHVLDAGQVAVYWTHDGFVRRQGE
jgi:hypothetical protein